MFPDRSGKNPAVSRLIFSGQAGGHAALLAPTSPRKVPEWLVALKDALAAKCCVGDASGERGAAQ